MSKLLCKLGIHTKQTKWAFEGQGTPVVSRVCFKCQKIKYSTIGALRRFD